METQFDQIREQQKNSWNKFSSGWKKWDDFNMNFLYPIGEVIIDKMQLQDTDNVLDIAAGTGEPGLSIAGMVPNGKVTGTDIAEDMLTIALANAGSKGLTNYKTIVADVCALPFGNESFDAISCRMGFMFFPDMQMAANQMHRVLKPGGKIVASVWSTPDLNNWVTTIMSVIQKHIVLPPPVPGAPGMFRCCKPDFLAGIFENAGFKHINEQGISGTVDYHSFDRYWEMMLDVGAPIVAAMSGADDAIKATIKKEVAQLFKSQNPEGGALLNFEALVVAGVK